MADNETLGQSPSVRAPHPDPGVCNCFIAAV